MSALAERLIAARDRVKPLTFYGEDAVWRPAKEAHECMADAANALTDMVGALRYARQTILDLKNSRWSEAEGADEEWVCRIDAALAKAGAA